MAITFGKHFIMPLLPLRFVLLPLFNIDGGPFVVIGTVCKVNISSKSDSLRKKEHANYKKKIMLG